MAYNQDMPIDISKKLSPEDLKTPVGFFTTPFEATFSIESLVEDILHSLQSRKITTHFAYFYIIDDENHLCGIIHTQDLLYHAPKTPVFHILETGILKIYENDSLEKALKAMEEHHLLMIPVVSNEDKFLGILEIFSLPHVSNHRKALQKKAAKEDIFQLIGLSIGKYHRNSSWKEFLYRMPWLTCNLIGGITCVFIGQAFQSTLVDFVMVALFIPLVLTLSESCAIQSMTLSLRFLHMKKIHWGQVAKRLLAEGRTSILLGLTSGIVICFFYLAWSREIGPMFAISTSILISMTFSAIFGTIFPLLLHILKLDPKVASGPLVLMAADIGTIAIYFMITTALLL